MARELNRGEIWLFSFSKPDKRRPVLILTRQEVLPLLNTAMVAPITSSIRGLPSEVVLGVEAGLQHPSAINLDNVQVVSQHLLRTYIGSISKTQMTAVCQALAVAVGCEPPIA